MQRFCRAQASAAARLERAQHALHSHCTRHQLLARPLRPLRAQGYCVVPADKRFLLLFTFLKKNMGKKVGRPAQASRPPLQENKHRERRPPTHPWLPLPAPSFTISRLPAHSPLAPAPTRPPACPSRRPSPPLPSPPLPSQVMVFFSSCNSVKYHSELLNYIDIPVGGRASRQAGGRESGPAIAPSRQSVCWQLCHSRPH